jgi:outer membrane protein assembly factor BamB
MSVMTRRPNRTRRRLAAALAAILPPALTARAADWPQWGGGPTRNAVSREKAAPLDFQLPVVGDGNVAKPARGLAWTADLGHWTVVPPVVADGLVWACTGASFPDGANPKGKEWDAGVLKCFRESDGKPLWEHRTPRLSGKGVSWVEAQPHAAVGSAPLVEGDRLWYVNNRHEVACFDIAPLKRGTGEPAELWRFDLRKGLGVFPRLPLMQYGFAASVAGYKDRLYVVTHNGVDETLAKVPAPDAPSLVCLGKATGEVVWTDNSPGKNILQHQISSPLVVEAGGTALVVVGQGDGWLRAFDAATGELAWRCDLNPKDAVWEVGGTGTRNYVVATPISYDGRVYIATGQQAEAGTGPANLYCVDPTRRGDVSRELDAGPMKGRPNPNSAVVWYTPHKAPADAPRVGVGRKKLDLFREARDFYYGRTIASVTAHDGLVYAAELGGYVFCFDARTGRLYWVEDTRAAVYGQPLWVDGKVFVGTESGDLFVLAHGRERKLLAKIETDQLLRPGPVFANGTLYLTGGDRLYAVRSPK